MTMCTVSRYRPIIIARGGIVHSARLLAFIATVRLGKLNTDVFMCRNEFCASQTCRASTGKRDLCSPHKET